MKHGLTVTLVFEASSLNYGEGMSNISVLKHLTRADRQQYTYISRQALRYSMIDQLGWNNTPAEANGSGAKRSSNSSLPRRSINTRRSTCLAT